MHLNFVRATEIQGLVWLLSMPFTAELNSSMQCLTEVRYVTSDQHKESTKSRIRTFVERIVHPDTSLLNVMTGVTATKSVNVDLAKDIGNRIFDSMTGKKVDECTFKGSNLR